MECEEVPKIPISERMGTELKLNLGKLDDGDLDFLNGFKKVVVYGTRFCGNKRLTELADQPDCEALEKLGRRIAAPRPDLAEMVKEAVVAYLVKLGVGLVLWNLGVCVVSCISIYGLMLGLKATFHRMNNLHMHTEEPPCVIKYILWKQRLVYRISRKICCCRACKELKLPNLDGRTHNFNVISYLELQK